MVGVRVGHLAAGGGGRAQIRGVESVTLLPLLLVLEEQTFSGGNWPAVWLVTDGPDTRGVSCPGLTSDHSVCTLGSGLGCLLV